MPVLGELFKKVYIARFAESANVLIRGGIPITQAIEISSHTVGSYVYREVLHEAAEGIRRGELLSVLLERQEDFFPPMVSQMIAVGESTGKLDEMLGRMATFYEREVDDMVSNLVELIQPALMVVVGVLTGLLFASILLPIYNLVQAF
jgi:type IV pilus assembly protein PilC